MRAELVSSIETTNYILSLIWNVILLWLVHRTSPMHMGRYKYLLILFALNDITYATVHYFANPRVLVSGAIFSLSTLSFFGLHNPFQRVTASLYGACFSQSFVLLTYHFIYRAMAVKGPAALRLFETPWFIALLVIIFVLEYTAWFLLCFVGFAIPEGPAFGVLEQAYHEKYGIELQQMSVMIGEYKVHEVINWRPMLTLHGFLLIMGICLTIIIGCSVYIVRYLHSAAISSKARSLQKQLFLTLCVQTVVPLAFIYTPCGASLQLPALGFHVDGFSEYVMLLISFFPFVDALVVLLLITHYRRTLISCVFVTRSTNSSVTALTPSRTM